MSVNSQLLPALVGRAPWRSRGWRPPRWRPRIARAARTGALGLLVTLVLLAPFPAAAGLTVPTPSVSPAGDLTPPAPLSLAASNPQPANGLPLARARARGTGGEGRLSTFGIESAEQPSADEPLTTLERLLATPRPSRDPVALAARLSGQEVPWTASTPFVGPLQAGRQDSFFVLDQTDTTYKARPATLRLVSEHAYWYVQDGETVRDEDLASAARAFDEQTVPTVRRVFGSEWSPGIDGDPRVTIFLGSAPGVAAYFSSWDEYPRTVYRYSNEREIIHVDLRSVRLGSASFDGTLAHEFQHMIHWHQSPASETWLDEGFAELASSLAVTGREPGTGSLQRQPDVQLTAWSQSQTGLHYQAAYLFSRYLAQRFGEQAIAGILAERARPPESITAYLSRAGHGVTFEDVFEDWLVANLLDDPTVGDGRYAHQDVEHRAATRELSPDGQPLDESVSQFGAEYVELRGTGADAELTFEGGSTLQLVNAEPTSGRQLWWSNRADGLDSTLTRAFDLTGVSAATLRFSLWYDTERDFDFFYVLASPDGGTTWQVLHGEAADDANPTGNAIGPGYSGQSGTATGSPRGRPAGRGGGPAWIAETVDLTPFAGRAVLIRFEYITDQGYNARGVLVDDVEIPELGFRDDAEADAGWIAEGFLRSDNVIPQTWSLQLVEQRRGGGTRVRPLRVDASGRVVERLASLGGDVERAVLVIGGLSPRTLEAAPFRVSLRTVP